MRRSISLIVKDNLDPSATTTYTSLEEFDDVGRSGDGRVQIVTSKGDRITATPYEATFDNGLVETESRNAGGTVKDRDRPGGGIPNWQERTYTVDVCPPLSVLPKPQKIDPPDASQSAMDEATTQALANARRGMVSLPMLVKELPQSLRMVAGRTNQVLNAGESLVNYYHTLLRNAKNRRARRKIVVDANAAYLEFLFGWTPFIEETLALCDAIQKERTLKIMGRGRAKRRETVSLPGMTVDERNVRCWSEDGRAVDVYLRGRHTRTSYVEFESRVRASVRYEARTRWGATVSRYGLNIADVAFDAVPLSFLLNFSTNIQDFLTANTPMVDADYVTGHVTGYNFSRVYHHVVSPLWVGSQIDGSSLPLPRVGRRQYREERASVERVVLHHEPEAEFVLRSLLDASRLGTLLAIGIVTQHEKLAKALLRFNKSI